MTRAKIVRNLFKTLILMYNVNEPNDDENNTIHFKFFFKNN